MNLYELSNDFSELFDQFEQIEAYEPEKDENGAYIDENGNVIENPKAFIEARKEELRQAWFDTLDGIEGMFDSKAENIAAYIKSLEAQAEDIKVEKLRLQARQSAKEKAAARMREYLIGSMQKIKRKKIDMPKARITLKTNPESADVGCEREFIKWAQSHNHDDLLRYGNPEVRKTAVKEAIKNGVELPTYVKLVRTTSAIIK